jgi:hypothetical protein
MIQHKLVECVQQLESAKIAFRRTKASSAGA